MLKQIRENKIVLPAPNLSVNLPVLGPQKNKGTAHNETKAVASVLERANCSLQEGRIGTMNAYPRKSTKKAADNAQNAHFLSLSLILLHPPRAKKK